MKRRVAALCFGVLWLIAAGVQFNDPDWMPWFALYFAAAAASVWGAFSHHFLAQSLARIVAVVALVWAFRLLPLARSTAWDWNEVQRETGGLLLVGFWLLSLAGMIRWAARTRD